jgi:hypothetical protein
LEGVFGHGRKNAVCGSQVSWRGHVGALQGVGIFRKTGYPIFDRYQECGIQALTELESHILNGKHEHSSPAKRNIHAVLDHHALVECRGRVRRRAQGTALSLGRTPNELRWTNYKGEFLLGNRHYCYPLTVTDHSTRCRL